MRKLVTGCVLAVLVATGCDAADDVRVQPLPPLETSSPEARAGLPVVSGIWRFAGWELAPGDTGRVDAELPGFGELRLETQRLDSIAGFYLAGDARLPLIGEVRRDSVLALAGGGRYLAGRITADTLWLALTSLVEPGSWPDDARAAFVRSAVGPQFVRVKGQRPVLAAADSLAMDTARMAAAGDTATPRLTDVAPRRGVTPLAGKPFPSQRAQPRVGEPRPRQAEQQPPDPRRAEPLERAPPAQPQPEPQQAQPEPEPAEPEPQQAEPEPEPEPEREPRRRRPRLLGVPVDSLYSPTAARAISRPGEVSARR